MRRTLSSGSLTVKENKELETQSYRIECIRNIIGPKSDQSQNANDPFTHPYRQHTPLRIDIHIEMTTQFSCELVGS